METETRNLKLKTSWISSSTNANDYFELDINNTMGKIENNNESYTWYNVNLRHSMGDTYYNKYTKFSIKTIEIKNTFLATTYNTNDPELNSSIYDNTMIQYHITGLNFDPNVNNVMIQTMVDPILPTNSTGSGFTTPVPTKMYQPPIYYFSKPVGTDTVNIKIDRIVLNTQQPRIVSSINDVIGHSIFMFEIVGIN
jgi:hypothetical protein